MRAKDWSLKPNTNFNAYSENPRSELAKSLLQANSVTLSTQRGITLSYETVREWCLKFGQTSPRACAADPHVPATSGTWMKYSSRSMDAFITYGGPGW